MILVHAGIHVYALLPWLALLAMLVTLASGMTGQYLLDRSQRQLREQRDTHMQHGLSGKAIEKAVFWDAVTLDLMKKWRTTHVSITLAFGTLGLAHILGILLFWQWK